MISNYSVICNSNLPQQLFNTGLVNFQNSFAPNNSNDNEVRTSIKEVTSAIVHYVSAREQGSADKLNASSRYLHDSSSPSR